MGAKNKSKNRTDLHKVANTDAEEQFGGVPH